MRARKNLVVDPMKVRRLAKKLRTSESEAVRQAVDSLLASANAEAARPVDKRHAALTFGDLLDILDRLPKPDEQFADDVERAHSSQPPAVEAFSRWPS